MYIYMYEKKNRRRFLCDSETKKKKLKNMSQAQ